MNGIRGVYLARAWSWCNLFGYTCRAVRRTTCLELARYLRFLMLRCFQIMETSTKRVSIFWVTVAVVVVIALVIACRGTWLNVPFDMKRAAAPNPQLLPCGGNPASSVELGYPYVGTSTAEFTTAGDPRAIASY